MKRYLLSSYCLVATLFFIATANLAFGQTQVKVNRSLITDLAERPLDSPSFKWPASMRQIVSPGPLPSEKLITEPSSADGRGKFNIWLEFGDGGFTTSPVSIRDFGKAQYSKLMMAIPLYDTSKGKDETITRAMLVPKESGARQAGIGDNDEALLGAGRNVKITASNSRVVFGDPMALAITYKSPVAAQPTKSGPPGTRYFAIIYYNNNDLDVFKRLNNSNTTTYGYSDGITGPDIRLFSGQRVPASVPSSLPVSQSDYARSFVVEIFPDSDKPVERNFFVTMKANRESGILKQGDSCSVVVSYISVPTEGSIKVIDRDTLRNMHLERAFDPNHITVNPTCLLLPKGETLLNYRLEFQNLGKGPADIVKVLFHRPPGLNSASFEINSAKYAGYVVYPGNTPNVVFSHTYDANSNTDIFLFSSPGGQVTLKGTAEKEALTNPATTMGEIVFSVKTTANTEDSIKAYASILFHSLSVGAAGPWEDTVKTNTALTVYKAKACECDNTCIKDCYKILGLCWYWWVLILLLIIILLIWLLRRRR